MSHFTFDFSGMEKSKRRKGADYFSFPLFLNGKYFCLPEKDVSEYYLIILFDFKLLLSGKNKNQKKANQLTINN